MVSASIRDARKVEDLVRHHCGLELNNLRLLEVGPGQFLSQLTYFSRRNEVIGIDSDIIATGLDPRQYFRMIRLNGWRRTIKTLARKMLGADRRVAQELARQLSLATPPRLNVQVMDVNDMWFESGTFDFVYCRSVLHHLCDPGRAISEIARVVRPSGAVYISIHPFTSPTGSLDPRLRMARTRDLVSWPHLRNDGVNRVYKPNVFLNQLRLHEWEALFNHHTPGATLIINRPRDIDESAVQYWHDQDQLLEYSVHELLAGELIVLWRKPATV